MQLSVSPSMGHSNGSLTPREPPYGTLLLPHSELLMHALQTLLATSVSFRTCRSEEPLDAQGLSTSSLRQGKQ